MMQRSIFRTSLPALMQKNKFFQCFTCLQQFDSNHKYPMQVCQKQHFMCQECVNSKVFKKNSKIPNQYLCSLCQQIINEKLIKRSPFLLRIKQFITKLIEREETRKHNYKQVIEKMSELNKEILDQNSKKDAKIQQLQRQLKEQYEVTNMLLQQIQGNQVVVNELKQTIKPLNQVIPPKQLLTSKIGIKIPNDDQQKQPHNLTSAIPSYLSEMLRQIQQLKQQINNSQVQDEQQLAKQLQSLQKQQDYVKEIIYEAQQQEKKNRSK